MLKSALQIPNITPPAWALLLLAVGSPAASDRDAASAIDQVLLYPDVEGWNLLDSQTTHLEFYNFLYVKLLWRRLRTRLSYIFASTGGSVAYELLLLRVRLYLVYLSLSWTEQFLSCDPRWYYCWNKWDYCTEISQQVISDIVYWYST